MTPLPRTCARDRTCHLERERALTVRIKQNREFRMPKGTGIRGADSMARAVILSPDRVTCTAREAANATGLSKMTILRMLDGGRLTGTKLGGRRLVHIDSLKQALALERTA